MDGGNDVSYYGPENHSPNLSANMTPFNSMENTEDGTVMAQISTEYYDSQKATKGTGNYGRKLAQTAVERPFYEQFAQQETTRRCTTTMLRNWNTTDDYETLSANWMAGDEKFTDINFPVDDAIYWADFNETGGLSSIDVHWERISGDNFPSDVFWGPNGSSSISPTDIRQGYIGNCWVMAAMSALAERPERVDSIMISNDLEEHGMYAMTMYSMGVPFTQIIDDYMPMSGGNTIFASIGYDGSFWAALVEKFFAKWYGNYEHLVGGWMNLAVAALNGSPWIERGHNGNHEEIWNFITNADQDNDIITAASQFCGTDADTNEDGVACSHAYTVIHTYTI